MTNKTLSEQICEVCGIEPIYHFYDESVDPILDEYLTKQEILEQYVSAQTPFEDYKKYEIYPDFENKNFAKLFNMITTIEDFSFSTGLYYIPYIPSYRQLTRLSTPEGDYESEN